MNFWTGLARVALVLVAAATLAGCGITQLQDLNFRVDNRLHFGSPQARSTVHQPVTITWRMDDFRVAAKGSQPLSRDAGYFAIFVDQTPIKPGHTLGDVANGDTSCQPPSCPDKAYLALHDIYTTTSTSIQLPLIPNISGSKEKLQLHAITIVLMDTSGHRIGESAWELDIRIPKAGT